MRFDSRPEPDWQSINRFLHDELAQLLSLALIHLDQAQHTPASALHSRCLIQQSLSSTRAWLNQLHGMQDHSPSLAVALHDGVRRLGARHDRDVRFVQEGDPLPMLPEAVVRALLDATQELLANACRHTPPDAPVQARLLMRGAGLSITVSNTGMDSAGTPVEATISARDARSAIDIHRAIRGGLGLQLVRQRLQSIGASLRWRAGHRSGVQARIRWCAIQEQSMTMARPLLPTTTTTTDRSAAGAQS